jgi:hypothetical protein
MRARLTFFLALLVAFSFAPACKKSATKTVSFTLSTIEGNRDPKPFANEEIAIFPLEGENIRVGDNNRLGLGKTNAEGHASIEFQTPAQYKEYVLLGHTKNIYMMLRTHEGKALTFKCENPTCDLGNVVFEIFEFSFKGGS